MVEWRRIAGLSLLAFVILASYEAARPATESLFLKAYGADALPYVWIAVGGGAAAAVTLYNRMARRMRLMRLMSATAMVALALFGGLLLLRRTGTPGATFLLYVVKDVYVVILVEIFWSHANSVFPIKTARWIYGLFCVAGSLGGAASDFVVGRLSAQHGTSAAYLLLGPLLAAIALGALLVPSDVARTDRKVAGSFRESLDVLERSPYLTWMLLLIATTQVVITLIDFHFNSVVEQTFPDMDARTGIISKVYFAINLSAIVLQLSTGPILRVVGVSSTLLFVPLMLGSTLGAFVLLPRFILLAASKVLSKCLDYSLFRAAKEILYIPLSYAEKTQGKAIVDMLTYRVAKAGASLLLIALVGLERGALVMILTLSLIGLWLFVTRVITRRYKVLTEDGE